ncbi:MAG: sugar ABC transporter permease [Armatimonadota bacterium]|nr:sugar ABC transporter permease [Armatimonadota bacterium]MDR7427507.1 sugar ABC transporter permease [Armatimonadota bacterium]MDR7463625.1 sugar ABC transporter permease [Armatimonadota bacterium]MDR7469840.1 sugar ABC transporter permease [Armatimonadota bacterium]MDR7475199.1 sugar ABC transporter permease [Armatimonadota bacterium]
MTVAQRHLERPGLPVVLRIDWLPYLLLLPTLIFLAAFFVYPMLQALALSIRGPDGALTLRYFQAMVGDTYFSGALRNSLLLAAMVIPLQVTIALLIALLVHSRFTGHTAFLYVAAIPLGISDLAAGLVWLSIFTERGYLNMLLQGLNLVPRPITFLTFEQPLLLYGAIVATEVWRATAIVMLILVAGLQLIPRDFFETAEVFGATGWRKLRYVTLPLLRPVLQTALIIRTILAFQLFATVITLAGRIVPVLAGEAYFQYTIYRNPHVASAYAVLIMGTSMAVTVLYLRLLRTREEEVARA